MTAVSENKYPRLLVVGVEDIFKSKVSSAFTARSFLEGWPSDSLRQVVCGEAESSPNTFVLSNKDRYFYRFFSLKKPRPVSIKRDDSCYYQKKPSIKSYIHQRLVYIYSCLPFKHNNELEAFLDSFNPDIIYSYSASYSVLRLILKISKQRSIPYVPHFYDDWPNILFDKSRFFHSRVSSLVQQIIKRAPVVFCICELMCKEYKKRYGYDKYQPLMHSVPQNITFNKDSKTMHLIYAGSIYLGRYKSLLELCKVFESAYSELPVSLTIYTNNQAWEELHVLFAPYPFVEYGGFVSQDELTHIIHKADGLVFIESLDEEMLVYTRLSMSTKIPEYLSSGHPILAIGNEQQGSIAYLKEHDAAYVITEKTQVLSTVSSFLHKERLNEITANALELFKENHLQPMQIKRFHDIMVSIVG